MQIFHNRPLALSMCLFAVVAVAALRMERSVKFVLLLLSFCALLFVVFLSVKRRRAGRRIFLSFLCIVAVFAALFSSFLFFNVRYANLQTLNGSECEVEGTVLERIDSAAYDSHLRVRVTSLNGEKESMDAILECSYISPLQVGERFRITVIPREYTETEEFDEESYRLADGCLLILTSASSQTCEILSKSDDGLLIQSLKYNTRLSYSLQQAIGGEAGGMASALLLGNRAWLFDDTALDFRRAGVSHLLALSGLHVSILIGFLEFLLRKLRVPKIARAVLIPLAAVGYLALTGFAVSTCRAVLMIYVLYLALLLRTRYDAFTALCTALTLILLITPYAVADISMWMSFLAAGSIIVFSPAVVSALEKLQQKRKFSVRLFAIIKGVVSSVAVGVVANLALLLLTASVFGEISLTSVPATLLLSIPVTLLMILATILLCLPFLPLLPSVCATIGDLILYLAERFSNIRHVLLPVGDIPTRIVLVLLTVVLILLAVLPLQRKRWTLLPIALSIAAVVSSLSVTYLPPQSDPTLTILPAGRGEVRLYTQNGEAVLVNATSGNASEAFEIKSAALDARCTEIRDLVLCRYYNQATYFIARLSARMRVAYLHLPEPTTAREKAIAARLTQEAELHGIRVIRDAEIWLATYP